MKLRMVDRILSWEARASIRGLKTVSFEEYSLKEPFGCEPHLPESLLMECMFQLGNWLVMLSSDFQQMGVLVRMREIRFHELAGPGQQLLMNVDVRRYRDDGITFDGRVLVGRRVIAEGRGCLATPVALSEYHDADDLRVLFSQIYRPDAGGAGSGNHGAA